jgi:hypothetical protein
MINYVQFDKGNIAEIMGFKEIKFVLQMPSVGLL